MNVLSFEVRLLNNSTNRSIRFRIITGIRPESTPIKFKSWSTNMFDPSRVIFARNDDKINGEENTDSNVSIIQHVFKCTSNFASSHVEFHHSDSVRHLYQHTLPSINKWPDIPNIFTLGEASPINLLASHNATTPSYVHTDWRIIVPRGTSDGLVLSARKTPKVSHHPLSIPATQRTL